MFYFHEILKKRGKFGIIWLAATAPKRLNRREIYSVDIVRRSKEVEDIITNHPSIAGRKNVHSSLYLSSQLMFGLASVHSRQLDFLYEEAMALSARIGSFRRVTPSGIDLKEPTAGFRVTFDEPDFENAPIDFGSLSMLDESYPAFPSLEYFVVSTPRSSEEWHISPGHPDQAQSTLVEIGDEHTARPEDITMPEDIPVEVIREEEPIVPIPGEDVDFLTGLPFVESPQRPGDVTQPDQIIAPDSVEPLPSLPRVTDAAILEEIDATITQQQPSIPEGPLPVAEEELRISDLRTPDIPITVSEPVRRTATVEEGDTTLPPPAKPDKRKRRTLFEDSETSFVLGPAHTRTGRRRRRRLIIDHEKELTRDQIARNIETANENLIRPLVIPPLEESVESMFNRFGLRAAAHGNKIFWRKLKTQPQPNDPAKFGLFAEPGAPVIVPAEVSVPDTTAEPVEELREEFETDILDEQNVTGSKTTLISSHYLQESRDRTTGVSSLQVPDVSGLSEADIMPMREIPGAPDEAGPDSLIFEAMREPETLIDGIDESQIMQARKSTPTISRLSRVCVVSPEKTPPPPSPEVPQSPLVDHAMSLIKETFNESPVAGSITFSSVIKKTPGKRIYVAKLFNLLLSLHASSVIRIEQSEPYGEIFISKGPNFGAFY